MRDLARLAGLLVFSWSLQVRAPLMAQDSSSTHVASTDGKVTDSLRVTDSVGADSTTSKENAHSTPTSLETALPGVKISGYAEASYTYSTAALGGGPVVGRSFDRNK